MSRKQKVKQILTENLVPDKAEFGTVFICKDTQQIWFAALNGDVLNLSDVLEGKTAVVRTMCVGPQGPPGIDGRDADGCTCRDAADAVSRVWAALHEWSADLVALEDRVYALENSSK